METQIRGIITVFLFEGKSKVHAPAVVVQFPISQLRGERRSL